MRRSLFYVSLQIVVTDTSQSQVSLLSFCSLLAFQVKIAAPVELKSGNKFLT